MTHGTPLFLHVVAYKLDTWFEGVLPHGGISFVII
jgi:hypothetical protein